MSEYVPSIIELLSTSLKVAFSPKRYENMEDLNLSNEIAAIYITLLALIPTVANDLKWRVSVRLYISIIIGAIVIQFLIREGVLLLVSTKNKDITREQIFQVMLISQTPAVIAGALTPIGTVGFIILGLVSLYGFYLVYQGFRLYLDASDEVAKLGVLGVFIFGSVLIAIANFL